MTTVGLAVIVGPGDAALLPPLLASVAGHVDQVAVLDTTPGREVDATLLPAGTRTGTFPWDDDFADARNAADALLTTDYVIHADCDEIVVGAGHVRTLADQANGIALWGAQFNVMPDDEEHVLVLQPWIVPRGAAPWRSAIHAPAPSQPLTALGR
jgi:hypothetical protein